jgi:hypothetical protein
MDSTGAQSDGSTWRTQEGVDPRRSAGNSGHHFSDKPNGFRPWRTDSNCNRGIRAERRVGNATLAIETAVQMRDRRLLRAEERANQISVKMVGR